MPTFKLVYPTAFSLQNGALGLDKSERCFSVAIPKKGSSTGIWPSLVDAGIIRKSIAQNIEVKNYELIVIELYTMSVDVINDFKSVE